MAPKFVDSKIFVDAAGGIFQTSTVAGHHRKFLHTTPYYSTRYDGQYSNFTDILSSANASSSSSSENFYSQFLMTTLNSSMTGGGGGEEEEDEDPCAYYPQSYLTEKFFLITVFGSMVASLGIFHNALLISVLSRSPLIRTHVFYLCILAVCDIVAEVSYISMMSVQILFDYAQSIVLYRLWHSYVRWVFASTHVAMTVSAYMIVSASAERFLSTLTWFKYRTCTGKDRWMVVLGVFCFALVSKGTVFWEVTVIYRENCTDFGEYIIMPSMLAQDVVYKVGYALWFRHIAHVFLPFALLLVLNGSILLHLKSNPMEMHSALISLTLGDLARQRKKSIRAATLMLCAIVSTYLISNLLNVIISIWEHVDKSHLESILEGTFYTFAADTISLLTIVTGCIRLPIYCACNKLLRQEVFRLLGRWKHGGPAIRDSCKRLFVKAAGAKNNSAPPPPPPHPTNNNENFVNLCDGGTVIGAETKSSNVEREVRNGSLLENRALINGSSEWEPVIKSKSEEITVLTMSAEV